MSEEQLALLLNSVHTKDVLDIRVFFGPLAIIVSAVFAFVVGWRAITVQRRVARNRATLDVLFRLESDQSFLKAAAVYRDVKNGRGFLSLLGDDSKKSNRDKEEEFYVDTYLNHLELICVGISEDTIDELFVFQYMRGSMVHDWHASKEYIKKVVKLAIIIGSSKNSKYLLPVGMNM